jgi:plastocyanin
VRRRINYINHDINSHLKRLIDMAKKRRHRHHQQNARSASFKTTMTRKRIITYGIIAAIISGVGIAGYKSMIPTNGNTPVFGLPINHYVKAKYSAGSGYAWVRMSSGSPKGVKSIGEGSAAAAAVNPSYVLGKGGLQSMHVVNGDYQTHSKHNFNIDEFNVHSKDLDYTQSQTLTFVADKPGTFHYYCSIHPEMKGDITIQ